MSVKQGSSGIHLRYSSYKQPFPHLTSPSWSLEEVFPIMGKPQNAPSPEDFPASEDWKLHTSSVGTDTGDSFQQKHVRTSCEMFLFRMYDTGKVTCRNVERNKRDEWQVFPPQIGWLLHESSLMGLFLCWLALKWSLALNDL